VKQIAKKKVEIQLFWLGAQYTVNKTSKVFILAKKKGLRVKNAILK